VYVDRPVEVYIDGTDLAVPDTAAQVNTLAPSSGTVVSTNPADTFVGPVAPVTVEPQKRIPVNNGYLADGVQAFRDGDYDGARRLFSYSVLDAPQNGFGELSYALALFAQENYAAAAGAIRRGLSLVPDVIDRPIDVQRMYDSEADLIEHVQTLRLHVAANPNDADAWLVLGYVLYSSGDPEGAYRALEQASQFAASDTVTAILRDAAKAVTLPESDAATE